ARLWLKLNIAWCEGAFTIPEHRKVSPAVRCPRVTLSPDVQGAALAEAEYRLVRRCVHHSGTSEGKPGSTLPAS
ncbi:hypothetical protein V5H37_23435, partial [Salmonella enterica]|uniref:hypothetical protein n=1 Tax=Salmonella enterica TaxID=28901 RepID=UPI002FCDB93D